MPPASLAQPFLARRGDDAGVDVAALETALREAVGRAVAAWPQVELDPGRFAALLADRTRDEADPIGALEGLRVTDLYLACACAEGNGPAITAFTRTHRGVMRRAFGGVSAQGVSPEDLEQRILERLLVAEGERPPRILDYEGRASLGTWVRVAASRLRIDVERRRSDKVDPLPSRGRLDDFDPVQDPELSFLKDKYREAFGRAFAQAIEELAPRDRNVLRYSVVDGISATKIAALYQVDRATAKRWLATIRARLLDRTRAALMAAEGLAAGELDSVMRLIESRMNVTISRHLRTDPELEPS